MDDDQTPQDVTDAIIIDAETDEPENEQALTNPTDSSANQGSILIEMEGTIKNYMASIDKLQTEAKKQKEMLDDIFANDPTYQSHAEAAKQATKVKQATKAEILKRPQAKELNDRIKTMKSELKEQQGALSDYLQEYQRMSGVNEIEGEDGEVREIVYVAKLVRKSFKL
jgi:organic radical activating enzyme